MGAAAVAHRETPRAGRVLSSALSVISIAVLAVCLSRRFTNLKSWRKFTLTRWLILVIYIDSTLFVSITAVLAHGFGLNTSEETCSMAILLCLICYMSTKILIYYYLIEKVYIVNEVDTPRLKSKMYLFNCFGMLVLYCVVVVLNFVYRISTFNPEGLCIIGMEKKAMMPLIILDVIVNLYLTALFIIPLRALYSFKNPDSKLRTVTFRTFIGSCTTLISSVINLTILMALHGEPAWICLMCCNFDILFSTVVLHWVTSKDTSRHKTGTEPTTGVSACGRCNPANGAFINTFHQDRVYCGENNVAPMISITSISGSASADEEMGLVRKGAGVEDSAVNGEMQINVCTVFEWKDGDSSKESEKDSVDAVDVGRVMGSESWRDWDKDVDSSGERRRYSVR